jgi:branched-chain amino acid aminotransferase
MAATPRYIWLNGELKNFADGTVNFVNAGLHYGVGVFEGIRCYATERGPAVFRLHEHVDRLLNSAHIMGFRDVPYDRDAILEAIRKTIAANELGDCYIRPLIWLDAGMNMVIDTGKLMMGIAVWEWTSFMGPEAKARGVRANISSFTRHHPNIMMTKAKTSGNYVNSVLAKTESVRLGFDEAIMLDPTGYVAECTGENLFVVRGGHICTVPRASILEGITRDALLTLARDLGYGVSEEPISRDQLYISDEVFVCGTAAEVLSIREIDFRQIGNGTMGPVAARLQETFEQVVRGRHPRSEQWLSPVRVPVRV